MADSWRLLPPQTPAKHSPKARQAALLTTLGASPRQPSPMPGPDAPGVKCGVWASRQILRDSRRGVCAPPGALSGLLCGVAPEPSRTARGRIWTHGPGGGSLGAPGVCWRIPKERQRSLSLLAAPGASSRSAPGSRTISPDAPPAVLDGSGATPQRRLDKRPGVRKPQIPDLARVGGDARRSVERRFRALTPRATHSSGPRCVSGRLLAEPPGLGCRVARLPPAGCSDPVGG